MNAISDPPTVESDEGVTDYPRPSAPHPDDSHTQDDERKVEREKKYHESGHDTHKHVIELAKKKAEIMNQPTRESHTSSKGFGAAGRIAQPAGKELGI